LKPERIAVATYSTTGLFHPVRRCRRTDIINNLSNGLIESTNT